MRNLQEQVKKAFCYQKFFWPFTVWINCSSDLRNIANSWPSASNFKSFSRSLVQFFLKVVQNNFDNKIPFFVKDFSPIWSGDGFVLRQEFLLKKNLNQKQQKKPANSAASSQKPLRYQGRRNVKNFGGTSQLVGHNLPTPTPWLEKGEFD